MLPRALPIDLPMDEIRAFCERNHIRRLALFGSVLREDFGPESDVDVLVEFEPLAGVTLLDIERMQQTLGILVGRRVDLRTLEELHPSFRSAVQRAMVPVYEQ